MFDILVSHFCHFKLLLDMPFFRHEPLSPLKRVFVSSLTHTHTFTFSDRSRSATDGTVFCTLLSKTGADRLGCMACPGLCTALSARQPWDHGSDSKDLRATTLTSNFTTEK